MEVTVATDKKNAAPPLLAPFTTATDGPIAVKTAILIYNPVGGKKKGTRLADTIVIPMLQQAGVNVVKHRTERPGHAEELGRTVDLAGVDALIAMGGDGTLSDVVTGFLSRATPASDTTLGFIPAGTGNTYIRELLGRKTAGARAASVRAAVDVILAGRTRRVDAAKLEFTGKDGAPAMHYAINTCAAGFAASANKVAERRRYLGSMRYSVTVKTEALLVPRRKALPGTIAVDGGAPTSLPDVFILALQNNKFTGTEHRICPRAQLDDGKLDLVYTNKSLKSIVRVAGLDAKVKGGGKHVHDPIVEYKACESLHFATDVPSPLMIDGDILGNTPLTASVAPKAFPLFTPEKPPPT